VSVSVRQYNYNRENLDEISSKEDGMRLHRWLYSCLALVWVMDVGSVGPAVAEEIGIGGQCDRTGPTKPIGIQVCPRVVSLTAGAGEEDMKVAGWATAQGYLGGSFFTAFLDQSVAREMYRDVDTIIGGAIRPAGQATAVPGGYRVSGRWSFGSGCHHCTWLTSGCVVSDGDGPRLNAPGMPDTRICFLPDDRCDILDTWTTTDLRGSASHDYAVTDLFVPEERTFSLAHSPIQRAEPL
jgi:hypothetical protein